MLLILDSEYIYIYAKICYANIWDITLLGQYNRDITLLGQYNINKRNITAVLSYNIDKWRHYSSRVATTT